MAELSIIEWGVYGFFAYTSMLMLIISVVKETPDTKSHSIVRATYLIPGIIAALIIAASGENIIISDVTNTIIDLNTTNVWTETIRDITPLQNPIWVTFHGMLGIIMIVYVIIQVLYLFTKLK